MSTVTREETTSVGSQPTALHTPGPWTVGASAVYSTILGPDGELLAFKSIEAPERSRANLRLIAAAPDLLDALKDALSSATDPTAAAWYERVIARAEGRS